MSVKAMGRVFDSDLRPTTRLVALAYADHASHDGRNIYPSVGLIAKKTGLSRRTVQTATRELESLGWLLDDGIRKSGVRRWYMPPDMGGGGGAGDAPPPDEGMQEMQGGGAGDTPEPSGKPPVKPSIEPSVKAASPEKRQNLWVDALLEIRRTYYKNSSLYSDPPVEFKKYWQATELLARIPETDNVTTVEILCESKEICDWLRSRSGEKIAQKAIEAIDGKSYRVRFIADAEESKDG